VVFGGGNGEVFKSALSGFLPKESCGSVLSILAASFNAESGIREAFRLDSASVFMAPVAAIVATVAFPMDVNLCLTSGCNVYFSVVIGV